MTTGPAYQSQPLRFGLVGTGFWARTAHAAALASADGIEFAAVWGRNLEKAAILAAEYGAAAYGDLDAFLANVDAVAFSVPPDVQAALGARAALAGKHLLLEKPIAVSAQAAEGLVAAVADAGVASVVFFTLRFQPDLRAWLADIARAGSWSGGYATWLGSVLRDSSPFNTPWRQEKGGLWDVGPHLVGQLWACLGPVVAVTADTGPPGATHLILHHEGGQASTATVTLSAPPAADGLDLRLWGEPGRAVMPGIAGEPHAALLAALAELAANIRSGQTAHPCDAQFGWRVWRVLDQAQRQLDQRG